MSFAEPLDLKAGPPRWLWPLLVMMAGLAAYSVFILSLPPAIRLSIIVLLVTLSSLMVRRMIRMDRYRLLVGSSGVLRLQASLQGQGTQVVSGLDHVWLSGSLAILLVRTETGNTSLLLSKTNNDPDQFRRFSVWLRYAHPELAGP